MSHFQRRRGIQIATWPISAGDHSMGLHTGIVSVLTLRVADATSLASAQTQSTEHEGTSRPKDGDLSRAVPSPMALPPGTPDLQLPWHAGTCQKTCTWWRSPSISSRSHPLTAKTWTRPNEAGLGVVGAVPDCHPIAHWIFAHDLVPQEESLREPNFHVLHSTSTKMPRKRLQIWQGWMQPQRVPRHFPRKTADRGRGTRWWRDAVSIGQSGPGLAEGGNLPVILSCKRGISISL